MNLVNYTVPFWCVYPTNKAVDAISSIFQQLVYKRENVYVNYTLYIFTDQHLLNIIFTVRSCIRMCILIFLLHRKRKYVHLTPLPKGLEVSAIST